MRDGPRVDPADVLTDALTAVEQEDQRRALRALLASPLLTAAHPAFALVRRHHAALREWLARETGWALHVDPEVARLAKIPAEHGDPTRSARAVKGGEAFSRRRYVLFCLALAALERGDAQTTLGRLAEAVVTGAGDPVLADAGVHFDLGSREERSDLVAVVTLLLALGVLTRIAGDEQEFLLGRGDALYDVERRVLAGLLVTRRGPSTVAAGPFAQRLAAVTEQFGPDTEEARNRALRQGLTRRLLDDPVVYYADLSEAEQAYLASQRAALLRRVSVATGLVAETRAEGIAMVDPAGDLTDVAMPAEGTDGHATLLLADYLATRAVHHPDVAVPRTELHLYTANLADRHKGVWRKDLHTQPGAVAALCDKAVNRLVALRLARLDDSSGACGDGVVGLPALARFALGEMVLAGTSTQDKTQDNS